MRIKLKEEDLNKLIKLLETKEENIAVADYLNDLCFSLEKFDFIHEVDIDNSDEINKVSIETLLSYFELDDKNEENLIIINRHLKDAFHYVDINKYENNPYYKNVNVKEVNYKNYKLNFLNYPGGSFFPLDDITVDDKDYYLERSSIGISRETYKYLTLSKNNNIWMCITPNEINTMEKHIAKAKGNIVTFGLGLGYFAYMASMKNDVKNVTIIEKDKDIISLYNQYIFPFYPYKNKIHIVEEDAIKYIEKNQLSEFDYAFFDLWHNAEDGLPLYLKIKSLDIKTNAGYWIEESLICMYRRCLLTVIYESLNGYSDDDYRIARNPIEKVINEIYFKTKKYHFESYDEITKFVSKENILKLISR